MFTHSTQIRVRYAETDQMGVVYYGNYAQYFEVGRTDAIRSLGYTYKQIEAMGIFMPVVSYECKFLRSALYDDLLTITTEVREMPTAHKIIFYTEVKNEADKLLTVGTVTLYFIDAVTKAKTLIPQALQQALQPYFS